MGDLSLKDAGGFKVMYYIKFCCVHMLGYVNDCDCQLFLALQQNLASCVLRDGREAEAAVT
jgi:hypothetical protein